MMHNNQMDVKVTDLHCSRDTIEFHTEPLQIKSTNVEIEAFHHAYLDLNLIINSSEVFQSAIREPATQITRVEHVASFDIVKESAWSLNRRKAHLPVISKGVEGVPLGRLLG